MASIQDIFGVADTLAAADLPPGVQVPVVIDAVRAVEFDDGNKLEIRFRGKQKALLANKTNSFRIADQHGDDYNHWPGKAIFLQRDWTQFQGRDVECVRVVRQPPARPAAKMPQPPAAPLDQHGPAPASKPQSQAEWAVPFCEGTPPGDEIPF